MPGVGSPATWSYALRRYLITASLGIMSRLFCIEPKSNHRDVMSAPNSVINKQ